MQRSVPACRAGLSRLEASIAPPLVAPAPITVWISSMNRIAPVNAFEFLDDRLQAFLEIAAIARAGDQRAHIQSIDDRIAQHFRHVVLDDLARQPFGDGGLADAGIAHEQRIVLLPAAENLDRALDFGLAADQRIDAALLGLLVQIDAISFRARRCPAWPAFRRLPLPRRRAPAFAGSCRDAWRCRG